ncbi:hypothetical protein U3653_23045 [Nocardia sp. CDC186]|uniref:DUF2637 domain-containing protein n=1 Tax=Nocardia implantans TaxID=3108168 RepID=A0ABU6B052_9NOCA|nr:MULTISPECIES: hypothetical protein [unclassified Nocardia]MBF6191344.1 hypothetical protein [Nocardia beijingensis]MEA3532985.1 hypothetical protein [Nocardia sp. CDC192]MEB3512917.1 hypothetical protein [Nocardia sp. CDC186]
MSSRSKPRTAPPDGDALIEGALPDRVQIAHERLAHQDDPALLEALSERELVASRELAELVRDHERNEKRARIQAAADAAERVRRTAAQLAEREAADLLRAAQAIGEQRHSSSPHAKVARLHQRKPRVLGLLAGVVAFSMLFSAVTVQQNIAPTGGATNPMFWLSYGLEALISVVLVALMLSTADTAEWGVIDKLWQVYTVEGVLLTASIALNTFPYLREGDVTGFGVHVVAPIMIGVALVTHRLVAERYGHAIERATAEVPDHEDLHARLVALTQVGDAGNQILPDILTARPEPVRHEAAADDIEMPATEHLAEQPEERSTATEHPNGAPATQRPMVAAAEHKPSSTPVEQSTVVEHPATEHPAEQPDERSTATKHSAEHVVKHSAEHELSSLRSTPPATEHLAQQRSTTAPETESSPRVVEPDVEQAAPAPIEALVEPVVDQPDTEETEPAEQVVEHPAARATEQQSTPAEHPATEHSATATEQSAEHEPSSPPVVRSTQRSTKPAVRSTLRSTSVLAERRAEQPTEHRRVAAEHARAERSTPRSTRTSATEHSAAAAHGAPPAGITASVWARAHEVKKATSARSSVEQIAQVLTRQEENPEHGASRIARDLHVGFASVKNWLEADTRISNARTGARVIELRK